MSRCCPPGPSSPLPSLQHRTNAPHGHSTKTHSQQHTYTSPGTQAATPETSGELQGQSSYCAPAVCPSGLGCILPKGWRIQSNNSIPSQLQLGLFYQKAMPNPSEGTRSVRKQHPLTAKTQRLSKGKPAKKATRRAQGSSIHARHRLSCSDHRHVTN